MATKTLNHSWSLSGEYGSEQSTTITSSKIATFVSDNIPPYSTINSVKVQIKNAYHKIALGNTKGDWGVYVQSSSGTVGTNVYKGTEKVTKTSQTLTSSDIKSYFKSGTSDAGALNGYVGIRVALEAFVTRPWYVNGVSIIFDYTPPTHKVTLDANGGTVSPTYVNITGGGTYGSLPTPTRTGYKFNYWTKDGKQIYSSTVVNSSHTLVANWTANTYTVNFKNADGSVVKTLSNIEYGKTLGTLPSVSRSGYTFGGWIPCAPAVKTDDTVLDSRQYLGNKESAQALHTKYKDYTDKLSVHIEAHMSDWASIKIDDKTGRQIISCTQSGGWGLGWQANTNGHGAEINAGGYKGIDLGFGTEGKFTNKTWYAFDIVFSGGTFEVYVNGTKKGTQSTSSTAISYHPDNTIFVGAEAGSDDTTPAGNYFTGFISNVFIANQGTRLVTATSSTTITGNVDYYPIWKKNYTIVFKNGDGSTLETVTAEHGKTPSCSKTPTKASTAEYNYTWDTSNPWSPAISKANDNQTYTPNFIATKRKYTVRWYNEDGTLLETDSTEYGIIPTYDGATPTKKATAEFTYTFKGWHIEVATVTGAIDYYARYTETTNKYTVLWKNADGTVLETDTTEYGVIPTYDGLTPTKAPTAQFTYTFFGWDTTIEEVTRDVVYTAVYTETVNKYTLEASAAEGGTVTGGGTYEYGSSVTLTATASSGYKFVRWSDGVTTASRTVTVTGNAAYTAVFEKACPIFVNSEQVQAVYVNESTKTITYIIEGEIPSVNVIRNTVDGWYFAVSNTVPADSHEVTAIYIDETKIM